MHGNDAKHVRMNPAIIGRHVVSVPHPEPKVETKVPAPEELLPGAV